MKDTHREALRKHLPTRAGQLRQHLEHRTRELNILREEILETLNKFRGDYSEYRGRKAYILEAQQDIKALDDLINEIL